MVDRSTVLVMVGVPVGVVLLIAGFAHTDDHCANILRGCWRSQATSGSGCQSYVIRRLDDSIVDGNQYLRSSITGGPATFEERWYMSGTPGDNGTNEACDLPDGKDKEEWEEILDELDSCKNGMLADTNPNDWAVQLGAGSTCIDP